MTKIITVISIITMFKKYRHINHFQVLYLKINKQQIKWLFVCIITKTITLPMMFGLIWTMHVQTQQYGISFHCYADDTQLYISTRPDETSKLSKLTECVKNVKDWMTNNFHLLNSDKTEILLIGPKKQYTQSRRLQFASRRMYCFFLYSQNFMHSWPLDWTVVMHC